MYDSIAKLRFGIQYSSKALIISARVFPVFAEDGDTADVDAAEVHAADVDTAEVDTAVFALADNAAPLLSCSNMLFDIPGNNAL